MSDSFPKGPTEPSADKRQAAAELWQIFVALSNEGFSERQALEIIGSILRGPQGQA